MMAESDTPAPDRAAASAMQLVFEVLPERMALCRLDPSAELPRDFSKASFWAITRTDEELSLMLPEKMAADVNYTHLEWKVEAGWRGLKIAGPLDFGMIGVIAGVSRPLADAGIPIFVISTYDTDYIFVKEKHFLSAREVIRSEGHIVAAPC